jgi:hypothetical protein
MKIARRDERGAVAVFFAICTVLIFGLAAMGVDLGNAMDRRKGTQSSADFAALAGANGLPATDDTTLQSVADYLNKNQPPTDGTDKCNTDTGPVTVDDLKDGVLSNGEVTFPSKNHIKVVSPASKVQFGLANAIGFSDTCVSGTATARIGSAGTGMAPYYATSTCDTGIQTLKSNASGLSIPPEVPQLYADSDTNSSTLTGLSPTQIALMTAPTDPVSTITITGTGLGTAAIDAVGFFNSDRTAPTLGTIAASPAQSDGIVAVDVPYAVASVQDVWYIRVRSAVDGKWSSRSGALSLIVGNAVLSCDPDSATGNFGSLDLPGYKYAQGVNGVNDELAMNIAGGLKSPLSLTTYTGTPFPSGVCPAEGATSPTVISDNESDLQPNTNCVYTSTGLDTGAATEGFITSVGSGADQKDGKLVADTSKACTDLGRDTRYPIIDDKTGNSVSLNGDLLTCFFKDNTTTVAQLIGYTGTDALVTQDIWKSPRFFLVPVFSTDPPGSKPYPIETFVAGFVTDQPTGATKANMYENTDQTDNGLVVTWKGGKPSVGAIRVVFFPLGALPNPPDGGTVVDYFGTGKKIITLTN